MATKTATRAAISGAGEPDELTFIERLGERNFGDRWHKRSLLNSRAEQIAKLLE